MQYQKKVLSSAPGRIDLAGGFTDGCTGFAEKVPDLRGAVCNLGICLRARIEISHFMYPYGYPSWYSDTHSSSPPIMVRNEKRELDIRDIGLGEYEGRYDLFIAACQRLERQELSLANTLIKVSSEIPFGSGLGGSGAMGVALMAGLLKGWFNQGFALHAYFGAEVSDARIAREARALEIEEINASSGWQDHYTAASGGINLWTATVNPQVPARQFWMPGPKEIRTIEDHLLLVKTPLCQQARSSHQIQLQCDLERANLLEDMVGHACSAFLALQSLDFQALGKVVNFTWEAIKAFTQNTATTCDIDSLIEFLLESGAYGAKACGSGGYGSCVVAIVDPCKRLQIQREIANWEGFELLPVKLDFGGVKVREDWSGSKIKKI